MEKPKYRRILIKFSGESMAKEGDSGIWPDTVERIAEQVREIQRLGVEVAVVIGGGNILRGSTASRHGMDRVSADYMGMLATVINALALQDALEKQGVFTRVMTAIEMQKLAEPYIRRRAIRHLEKGRVVIFAGGTGNPYFTTDTAAALRGVELQCQVLMKATKVDGVYEADPLSHPTARRFREISYMRALNMGLAVMDSTSLSLCKDNHLPIIVFDLHVPGSIAAVVRGEPLGTLVHDMDGEEEDARLDS